MTIPGPSKTEIRAARLRYDLTQTAAAELIYCGQRAWAEWEAGNREMHPAYWELFCIKAAAAVAPT